MESKKSSKSKKEKKPHYVNSKEFTQDIQDYYGSGSDEIGEKLGESIFKIAKGLSYAPNFINYSYKDDMVGDAIVKMFSALQSKKFNIDSGNNPFSYFTTIAFHAFINRIKKEKKQRQVVNDYQEMVYEELASEYKLANQQSNEPVEDDS
jgi:DNA-directed RNA polymerase specialized sigma24 family protein